MSKNLFNDFEGTSSKAWKQKIQVDLKGADYNDTLIWQTNDGIDVKPFYHSDQFDALPDVSDSNATNWKICQFIEVNEVSEAKNLAKDAIERGAESILFSLTSDSVSVNDLVEGIDLEKIHVILKCDFLSEKFINNIDPDLLENITCLNDIIGNLGKTGNWFRSLKDDHLEFEKIVKSTNQFNVDLSLYQNAGANIIQQVAYTLAHVNEYLNHFSDKLSENDKASIKVTFTASIGSNYFFEIAKLRALRSLWSVVADAFGYNAICQIIAIPSERNKTIYDYNVNMLRTTTECMSAVIGGANIICNLPYDHLYHNANEFGNRISRNQLLILKKESYLDKVNNPADGSYYIESLTDQISNKALTIFKDIEKNGGFLAQLKSGTIQRKIKESAAKEQQQFEEGKLVLLGTNKYPNPNDKMKNDLEKHPFIKKEVRKTLIEPIIKKRLSEQLEMNRLKEE